jgi:hypothetical protein
MGYLLNHNIELQSKNSCLSDWEIVANEQEQLIKDKAAGKIKGDLPFANSNANIRLGTNIKTHLRMFFV